MTRGSEMDIEQLHISAISLLSPSNSILSTINQVCKINNFGYEEKKTNRRSHMIYLKTKRRNMPCVS